MNPMSDAWKRYSMLSEWDLSIMKTHPIMVVISHANFRNQSEVVRYAKENFDRKSFMWKGGKFFFINREDAAKFAGVWA